MSAKGLKVKIHDLDIISRGKAWEKAKSLGTCGNSCLGDPRVLVTTDAGDIEIFNALDIAV